MKVYEDSIVRFSKRVNFDIGCQMNFTRYPVDMQKCEVTFESFGYQNNVITINFSLNGPILQIHVFRRFSWSGELSAAS